MKEAANSRFRGASKHAAYYYHGVWHLPHPISEESVLLLHFHKEKMDLNNTFPYSSTP